MEQLTKMHLLQLIKARASELAVNEVEIVIGKSISKLLNIKVTFWYLQVMI